MKKGTAYPQPSYALRPEFVGEMQKEARILGNIERAYSRRQYAVAEKLLAEWEQGGYEGELTRDEFYCEASRVICDTLGYSLVSNTGETVKVWCEVFVQFKDAPENMKRDLPFAYFRNARMLYNAKRVASPMAAICTALDNGLTAAEMLRWYNDPPQIEPVVLEYRSWIPKYLWELANILPTLNHNRKKVEYHVREIKRLVEED